MLVLPHFDLLGCKLTFLDALKMSIVKVCFRKLFTGHQNTTKKTFETKCRLWVILLKNVLSVCKHIKLRLSIYPNFNETVVPESYH